MNDDHPGGETEKRTDDRRSAVSKSCAFGHLSSQRRRRLLWLVRQHGRISLPDAAEEVAVSEADVDITELDPENVRDIYMMLYHSDVPRLASDDVIVYDQERDMIAPGACFQSVAEVLAKHFDEP